MILESLVGYQVVVEIFPLQALEEAGRDLLYLEGEDVEQLPVLNHYAVIVVGDTWANAE